MIWVSINRPGQFFAYPRSTQVYKYLAGVATLAAKLRSPSDQTASVSLSSRSASSEFIPSSISLSRP